MLSEIVCLPESAQTYNFLNTDELVEYFVEKYPVLRELKYQISVNNAIVSSCVKLADNDEIAFLPPFAGG